MIRYKSATALWLTSLALVILALSLSISSLHAQVTRMDNGVIMLEDFEDDTVGRFPYEWYDRDGNKRLPNHDLQERKTYKYSILEQDGNKFLQYEGTRAKHINFPLINKEKDNIYNIDIHETPVLSWKWRAHQLPENANEDRSGYNDTVASIYVVFDMGRVALFKKVPKTIRYTWSTTLDEGTELSKFFNNQKIIVLKSGREDIGKWITIKRNIVEDYRRLFGDDPPNSPLAILILSDGDSTGSYVKADYDDIKLMPEQ